MIRANRLWSWFAAEHALKGGQHVHKVGTKADPNDVVCAGGDSECPLWQMQLEEAMQTWSGS